MSDSKMCRNIFPCQQIKNCLSSLYQTLSTAVFATTLFVTKTMRCCVTHDATSSILLNSTNEANTFLMIYNILRFSRLSKLVSSNLKGCNSEHNILHFRLWREYKWVSYPSEQVYTNEKAIAKQTAVIISYYDIKDIDPHYELWCT